MTEVSGPVTMENQRPNRRSYESDEIIHGGKRRKRTRSRRKRGKELTSKYLSGTASVRAHQVRKEMFANGQPVAPYNTTQFLIEDHGDLKNIDLTAKPQRTRDSSFSIDSDEEFYSSPEDEEEFLSREFSNQYQDLHVERLNSMSKSEIIRDYLLLEGRYEKILIDLRRGENKPGDGSPCNSGKVADSGRDTDASSRSDHDVTEQLRIENRRLKAELEKVKRENAQLQALVRSEEAADSDSVDSESDSSSTTSTNSSLSRPEKDEKEKQQAKEENAACNRDGREEEVAEVNKVNPTESVAADSQNDAEGSKESTHSEDVK